MPKRKHLYVALYLEMLPNLVQDSTHTHTHIHTHTHTHTHTQSTQEQMEKTIDIEGNETGIRPPQVLPDLPEGKVSVSPNTCNVFTAYCLRGSDLEIAR